MLYTLWDTLATVVTLGLVLFLLRMAHAGGWRSILAGYGCAAVVVALWALVGREWAFAGALLAPLAVAMAEDGAKPQAHG